MKNRKLKAELTWNGKEEAVSTLKQAASGGFSLFERYAPGAAEAASEAHAASRSADPPALNRLYSGDNLQVLKALQSEFRGAVDFIYIDPPFCSGSTFWVQTLSANEGIRDPLKRFRSFSDSWEEGVVGYLSWLYPRLSLMYSLLSDSGNFVIHLDWRAASHVRLVLDEIFGAKRLVNEIVWNKGFRGTRAHNLFQRSHDILWWYAKGADYYWNQDFEPYKDRDLKRYNRVDDEGRRYARIKRRRTDGTIYYGKTYPGSRGKWRNDVISDVPTMAATAKERTGFGTQKPRRLLSVLLKSLAPPGGLAADFFCGSGTTLVEAAAHGCRFLGADCTAASLHTARKRLVSEASGCSFSIYREQGTLPVFENGAGTGLFTRSADGSVVFAGGDGSAAEHVELWAVDPASENGVFAPQWIGVGRGNETPPARSPVFGGPGPVRVMASARSGDELWFEV